MMKSLGTTAKTLAYYQQRQQIAAANVAQANTTSYKAIHAAAQGTDPGHPVGQEYTDWTQGALRETGRPLDLSLDGPGFFVVENQEGNQRLSRGGTFQLDAGGWLVDLAGNKVIGETGPMLLLGSEVTVGTDGSVWLDGEPEDKLRLVNVSNLKELEREPNGLFATKELQLDLPPGETQVRQGSLELANVDSVGSMVDLISIQRSYSANMQVLKAVDRILGLAATKVGEV